MVTPVIKLQFNSKNHVSYFNSDDKEDDVCFVFKCRIPFISTSKTNFYSLCKDNVTETNFNIESVYWDPKGKSFMKF